MCLVLPWEVVFGRCLLSSVWLFSEWRWQLSRPGCCHMSLSVHSELGDAPRYCQLLLPLLTHTHTHTVSPVQTIHNTVYASHTHTEKSQALSSGYMPVALALPSFASLTAVAYTCTHAHIHAHFQGDLVTFPVCPILPPSMSSVSSPMPSPFWAAVPPGPDQNRRSGPATNPCQRSQHHRRAFTVSFREQRQ